MFVSCLVVVLLVLCFSLVEASAAASSISTPTDSLDLRPTKDERKRLRELITKFPPKVTRGRIRQRALKDHDQGRGDSRSRSRSRSLNSWLDEWLDEVYEHENENENNTTNVNVEAVIVEEVAQCGPCVCECFFNLVTDGSHTATNDTDNTNNNNTDEDTDLSHNNNNNNNNDTSFLNTTSPTTSPIESNSSTVHALPDFTPPGASSASNIGVRVEYMAAVAGAIVIVIISLV
jgi:hypothetical protein